MQEIHIYGEGGQRLDSYLVTKLKGFSRTYINGLIKDGFVYVNGKTVKPSYMIKENDIVQVEKPVIEKEELIPENIPIEIVYEDNDIIVIDKPKGMIVHPTKNNYSGTLVNALLYHVGRSSLSSSKIRPGIVHRLDKDTTGLLVIAKNNRAYDILSQQFIDRTVKRVYLALVYGELDIDEAIIDAPIGRDPNNRTRMRVIDERGRRAITHYRISERFRGYTLLELSLKTGRTHQIRVHMDYIGHPIVGDPIYGRLGNEFNISGQLLHAGGLAFDHPGNGNYVEFKIGFPDDFKKAIDLLRGRS